MGGLSCSLTCALFGLCRFYGFPAFDHTSMKIGKFGHRGEWSSPDTLDRTIYPEDEQVSSGHLDSLPAALCHMN